MSSEPEGRPLPFDPDVVHALVDRHLAAGFAGLFVFALGGLGLEALHAVKAPAVVDAGRETTRLFLRLAHAHGSLLGLVQVAYGAALAARPHAARKDASAALVIALVLLPAGFALGALGATGGDPGFGVALAPVGAAALAFGLARTFVALRARPRQVEAPRSSSSAT